MCQQQVLCYKSQGFQPWLFRYSEIWWPSPARQEATLLRRKRRPRLWWDEVEGMLTSSTPGQCLCWVLFVYGNTCKAVQSFFILPGEDESKISVSNSQVGHWQGAFLYFGKVHPSSSSLSVLLMVSPLLWFCLEPQFCTAKPFWLCVSPAENL